MKLLKFISIFLTCISCHACADISANDQVKLEKFFEYLIIRTTFGYTLCGEKPISMETLPNLTKIPAIPMVGIFFKLPGYHILQKGLETWSKYTKLFPSKNFVLRFIPEYSTIVLINKKATLKVIDENLDLFHKLSSPNLSAEEFLAEICQPKNKEYMIRSNVTLLGILLGYGRNNAMAFDKKKGIVKMNPFNSNYIDRSLVKQLEPNFMALSNKTNYRENKFINKMIEKSKIRIRREFKSKKYFEKFMELYANVD